MIGNAAVGQSGGPTAAINASLAGVLRGVRAHAETIPKIYGMKNGIEGLLSDRLADLTSLSRDEERLSLLETTPASALGSCRTRLPDPDKDDGTLARTVEICRRYGIRYFFYIGGNDSMDTVAKLSAYAEAVGYEMRVFGVPKTIDNDLALTDHTPGYGSAAKYGANTMAELVRDCAVYTVPAVTVVEIMGRDAGWLTASAGLGRFIGAGAPDAVYLPERPFSLAAFDRDLKAAFDRHPNVVIAVSEGIRYEDGRYVCEGLHSDTKDRFGHVILTGAAAALKEHIREVFSCKARAVELSTVQRCAAHLASLTDLCEASEIAAFAVARAVEGESGRTAIFRRLSDDPYRIAMESAPAAEIANKVRRVPDEYITPEGNYVTKAFAAYLLPLIRGETSPVYENGVVKHFEL
ncbi:MAG: 6-phosphofructokinase [Clostridia bacterium]|nr:6-phosphofructokinase [Clostridia bacterium]